MTMTTMPNWLKQRAALSPQRIAVETADAAWTFAELDQMARSLAAKFFRLGIKEGKRVAILQTNSVAMIGTYHALSYLGATAVPLNIRLSVPELLWQIRDCEASCLLYDEGCRTQAEALEEDGIKAYHIHSLDESDPDEDINFKDELALDEPHTIIYTSGTTGRPKGVILTYGNHWWSAVGSALNLGLNMNDKWLLCLPMFHVSGLSILMKNVIYGMPIYLQSKFNASEVNQVIRERGVTMMSAVSAMVTKLLDDLKEKAYPGHFRCLLLGGGPAPLPMLEKCRDKGIPVFQTYGLSETASQIVTLSPEYMFEKLGSAGKPLFPAQIRIIDQEGRELTAMEEGEIIVKGPNITPGYWHRPSETNSVLANGWLKTGDIGYLDHDGFLYVLDRRKDMFISGGENVYPAEVEAALLAHPDIAEAGVIGVHDDEWGKVPAAFIRVRPSSDITESDVQMFLRDHLAGYKIPKYVYFVDELPRNASGKLLRRLLIERLPGNLR